MDRAGDALGFVFTEGLIVEGKVADLVELGQRSSGFILDGGGGFRRS
jgi:hypothetical protein